MSFFFNPKQTFLRRLAELDVFEPMPPTEASNNEFFLPGCASCCSACVFFGCVHEVLPNFVQDSAVGKPFYVAAATPEIHYSCSGVSVDRCCRST